MFTGDIFLLVYSVDNRESFDEVQRLRTQILECKGQVSPGGSKRRTKQLVPIVIVGNKCDLEPRRQVDTQELKDLVQPFPNCGYVEVSAKKNINIEEVFLKLFVLAKLPTEMSPSLHRKVQPSYIGDTSPRGSRRGMTLRRRLSDACGAVAPNVRRPSIRTDLLILQTKSKLNSSNPELDRTRRGDGRCCVQ